MGRLGRDTMRIERCSPISRKVQSMDLDITYAQYAAWLGGMMVQDAFPNLSVGEREFILTGITPSEWDTTFGTGEEDDDDTLDVDLGV